MKKQDRKSRIPVFLSDIESDLKPHLETQDVKQILDEIDFLKSLPSDELWEILNRKDLTTESEMILLQTTIFLLSITPFTLEKATASLDSLPLTDNTKEIFKVKCEHYASDPLKRALDLESAKTTLRGIYLSKEEFLDARPLLADPHSFFAATTPIATAFNERIRRIIFRKFDRLYKGTELYYKKLAYAKLCLAHQIKDKIDFIRNLLKTAKPNPTTSTILEEVADKCFEIGRCYKLIDVHSPPTIDYFTRSSYQLLSGEYTSKAVHQELDKKYAEAVETAEDRWQKGDPRPHHVMTKDLIEKDGFSMLNYNTLKKKLLVVAEGYKRDYQGDRMKKKSHS